ncbi:hypothetical protein [Ohtaekwangia koreensis]|nr:hypothetical protein [Ohtaekwangia koreensis]
MGPRSAVIAISLEYNDSGIRAVYFEQFEAFRLILHDTSKKNGTGNQM